MKIMLDTNIFSRIVKTGKYEIFNSNNYDYYVTIVQWDELKAIPDAKEALRKETLHILETEDISQTETPAIVGYAKAGCCVPTSDDDVYFKLAKSSKRDINDAMIGSAAKRIGCCVVTNDKRFLKKLKRENMKFMRFEEFLDTFS